MSSVPPHVRVVIEALKFCGARKDQLRTLTDSEWNDILSHWGWVRLTLPLRQVCSDDLPAWVRAQIDENIADNTERFERIKKIYLEIVDVLHDAKVEHLVLRGFAQWPAYMQGPRVRSQSDIDIFCPPESVFRARDAIRTLGYHDHHAIRKLKFVDHLPPLERPNDWQWRGKHFDPDIPVSVELYFRLWSEDDTRLRPIGLEHFWFRRVERQVEDFACAALDDIDSLAYSALRALRSLLMFGVLLPYQVYEIAWFLHTNAENEEFWKKREKLNHDSLRSLEAVCFKLAKEWFACRLPDQVERETRSLPAAVQRWLQRYADSPLTALIRPNKDALWLHLSLLESPSDKRCILWKRLIPVPQPAESVRHWTPRSCGRFLMDAIPRVPYHSRPLPRMLWHGFRRWWVENELGTQFWIFFAAFSCFDIGLFIFFFLYNLYLLDCGYTEKFLGQVTSANALGGIAGAIPAGVLAQRVGLRKAMLACLALVALLSALLAVLVSAVPQLCLAFLASAASTAWSVCTLPALAQVTTEKSRPLGFSLIMSSGIGLGVITGVVGGSLPGWLARIEPNASPGHVKEAALLIACAIVAMGLWPTSRLFFAPVPPPERKFYSRSPFLFRFLVAMAVWSLVTGAFSPFFNVYFAQYLRMPLHQVGIVSSASQLSTALAVLAAPLIFRRMGLVAGIMYSQIATAVALALLAYTSGKVSASVLYVLFSAVLWMSEPGMFSLLMDRVTPSERSGASALNLFVISLSNAVAAMLAGASFVRYGYPTALRATAVVAVVAAFLFRFYLGTGTAQMLRLSKRLALSDRFD